MWRHNSLAEMDEATLVERLTNDAHWRSRILGVKGIDSACIPYHRIPMTGLPGSPSGDIDVLLVSPSRPDQATVIEVKRVKIRNGKVNKLQEFTKGVRQANLLANIGFYQTYLYVLVAVDSRATNEGRISYSDGMGSELRSKIAQLISPRDLNQGIGLMHQEFVQPMDHAPLSIGSYGGHLVRLAESREQSLELTAWVAQVLAAGAA